VVTLTTILTILVPTVRGQTDSCPLTVTATHGSVVVSPAKAPYNAGEQAVSTPHPEAGYYFTRWSGDAHGQDLPLDLTVDRNQSNTTNTGPKAPDLPELELVDPDPVPLAGQIIYLDFDGAADVTYDGPVTVGPFDVPAFQAPKTWAGQEETIIRQILAGLERLFAGSGVVFTLQRPSAGQSYSTIYIGGDNTAFAPYGSFLGLAERVDVGNTDAGDSAFVFAGKLAAGGGYVARLTQLIAHEAGHLLGYQHTVCGDSEDDSLARCAAVFYVDQSDPQASDGNAGTEALPLKTIDRALTLVQPGDHVYIKGSTNPDAPEAIYDRSGRDGLPIQRPGTAANEIVVEAYPGHVVVLQGNGTRYGIPLDYASYYEIRGFLFRNFDRATEGTAVKTDILIENCEFTITHTTGLRLRNITNLTLRDVNVHHCFEAGIYIINSSHVRLERVISSFNDDLQGASGDGDGIDTVAVDDFVCVDCTAEGNSEDGFDLNSDGSLVNCVSRNNNVCGVKLWRRAEDSYKPRKMMLAGCVVSGHSEAGIKASEAAALDLFNSVVYGNGEEGVAFRSTTAVTTPVYSRILNTIVAGNGWNGIVAAGTTVNVVDASNNLYYRNGSANSGLHSDAASISGQDPLFVDPGSGLFQLQTGSVAIDHGVIIAGYHCTTAGAHPDQNLREWYGSAPDIGAYEVGAVALSPITDLSVSGTTQNSVSLAWTVPGDPLLTQKPTAYEIRYANSPLTDTAWATAIQVPNQLTVGNIGQAQSFTITGLSAASTYYFAIRTVDGLGNTSGLSNVVSATTGAGTGSNHAPVLGTIGNKSVSENQLLTFAISATDADGDPITYSATGLPAGATFSGQTFRWTPTYTQAGSYNVTFTASDGKTQTSQTITITVANTDRPPVLADIPDQSVNVSSLLTFTLSATDPDGDSLTYAAATLPGGATLTGPTFAWTPTSTQAGNYTVTFTVSDGTLSNSKTVSILVTQPNVAPVLATIGNQSVHENQVLTFTISATDGNGDVITYSAANLPSGAGLAGQTFSWTPTYTQAGSYNVTFTASDGQLQTSQAVTITVVNVDRPPVLAAIGNKTVDATEPLSFVLSAVDPDGDNLTYSANTFPSGATLTGPTFVWTPTSGQTGTYSVTFTVSDGELADSETISITVGNVPDDQIAPAVVQFAPAPDAIQVPLNRLVTLHITDANAGVDANSVIIRVDGSVVYQGNVEAYTSTTGRCSRSGAKKDYRFIYQPNAMFNFDQTVVVRVNAADLAGNIMNDYHSSFTTEMRAFGENTSVSPLDGNADSQPATARDPAGNLWVAWHAGAVGSRDIYVAKRPVGAGAFETPIRLTTSKSDQCNPALAVSASGAVYVVWQDNRNGNWDLCASLSSDGVSFSKEVRVTNSDRDEISPALVIDHQSPGRAYVAWQDDRNGNQDIYVASSTDAFATSTVAQVTNDAADQKEPALAVDAGNVVYLFWTDMRNGQADIYAAAAASGTSSAAWANLPIVIGAGEQIEPTVAAGAGTTFHLLWVDNKDGNKDIYYASLNGLPGSPVAGVSIVDDRSGADQASPAIVCGSDQRVFACWTDWRHTSATGTDTDLYVAELRSGRAGTNILVGDDGTNANQGDPAIGVDRYGEPYVVWTDYRAATAEIYSAATTLIDPHPLASKVVVASVGATIGTDPAAIRGPEDVSVIVPAGACEADLRMAISPILNPQVSSTVLLASYEFGPSGSNFDQPVMVTIPYTTSTGNRRVLPYWYDSATGTLSQQGVTDIQNLYISPKLSALQFRTTHFTPFYLLDADANGAATAGTAGGGCALSPSRGGSPSQLLVPYIAIAVIMVILRRRDRRKASGTLGQGVKG
jgi:PKD repeat protein